MLMNTTFLGDSFSIKWQSRGGLCEIFKFGNLDKGMDIFQFHEQLLSFLFSE